MITRRDSLGQALDEAEAQGLAGVATIVVSRSWWNGLSYTERDEYRRRAEGVALKLRVDDRISPHYVELRGGDEGPALSSEQPM